MCIRDRLGAERAEAQRHPRALILTPTRELAAQVEDNIRTYGAGLALRSAVIFGGVSAVPQQKALRRGVDLLVATPGRLLDHVQQGNLSLSQVEVFVLDEADRMLDMGFIHDIRRVLKLLPNKRQNLMFSATYSREIEQLAHKFLVNPVQINVAPKNATADRVTQYVAHVEKARKRALLSWLISGGNWQQVLVFMRTKHGANRLTKQLIQDGLTAAAIHGNKSQGARTKALEGFKNGSVRVLVATDVAARGLDISRLPHVINYELPNVPEDYVHRIGRTGRAGESGAALSLVDREEREHLRGIQKLLGRDIPEADIDWDKAPAARAGEAADDVRPPRQSRGRPGGQKPSGGDRSGAPKRRRRRGGGSGNAGGGRPPSSGRR